MSVINLRKCRLQYRLVRHETARNHWRNKIHDLLTYVTLQAGLQLNTSRNQRNYIFIFILFQTYVTHTMKI